MQGPGRQEAQLPSSQGWIPRPIRSCPWGSSPSPGRPGWGRETGGAGQVAEMTSVPWGTWAGLQTPGPASLSQKDLPPASLRKEKPGPMAHHALRGAGVQGPPASAPSSHGLLVPSPLGRVLPAPVLRIPSPLPSPGTWGEDFRVQTALAPSPH